MTKKAEQLQNGFSAFLQPTKKSETAAPAPMTGNETFSKHNLTFSDDLFEKIKILQKRHGKSQREVLDAIIRQYVEEYEKKHGEISTMTLEL